MRTGVAPRRAPEPAPIIAPRDVDPPGLLKLRVDATDIDRGIFTAVETIPVAGEGPMTLLYPKWMPGYHSPHNPIELFAGLQITAADQVVAWRRDPLEVYAFHVEVPAGAEALEAVFQFLSPTTSRQGDVVITPDMLNLQWGRIVLYPAGFYARRIAIEASLTLPEGWSPVTALETARRAGATTTFAPVGLDVLVDSPVMAGRCTRDVALGRDVDMTLFAHERDHLATTEAVLDLHRALVVQVDRLFASRHFDRYRFLVALTEELGGGGVEHQCSAEIILPPDYLADWERNLTKRDVLAHEFVHSWNGKFRSGDDSWSPSFQVPIRNSLMWVYEGQTQYWGHALTARAGLWSAAAAREALAKVAAIYDVRPGGLWRPLSDTTRDPVIASRAPLPWPSWQRSEDYYSEGQLLWLAVDTLIRELTDDRRSLDDFARAFFGVDDGETVSRTYAFDDVVRTLEAIAPYDWSDLLRHELERREPGAPLEGLRRGGYRLIYREHRSDFCRSNDAVLGQFDVRFSVGLTVSDDGTIQEVMWGGAAFDAGLTAGAVINTVNGVSYSGPALGDAIAAAVASGVITLGVAVRGRAREVEVHYAGGHRFPHLEPIPGVRRRLDEIFAAR